MKPYLPKFVMLSNLTLMNFSEANGQILNDICRALKLRRAEDGFSYRTHSAGRNDPDDPSTWNLPVYHCSVWIVKLSIIHYLRAFPHYCDVLPQFGINPESVFAQGDLENKGSYEN